MSQLALCLSLASVILFLRQCEHTTVVCLISEAVHAAWVSQDMSCCCARFTLTITNVTKFCFEFEIKGAF